MLVALFLGAAVLSLMLAAFTFGYVAGRPLRIDQRRRPTMIQPYRRRRYVRLQDREGEE
jgi:hypothetical protein